MAGKQSIIACLNRGKWSKPDMTGEFILRFTVLPSGLVGQAEVACSTAQHPPTEACLAEVFRGLHFPTFVGEPFAVHFPVRVRDA